MTETTNVVKDAVAAGRTSLGIELGSTRIKACLVLTDDPTQVVATGSHEWENQFVDRTWTYSLEDVWSGVQAAYAALSDSIRKRYGLAVASFDAIGVSAMMHGYLAFDAEDHLLTPFRTWRNTRTGPAATELTDLFGVNIPLRWSIAHLHQAVLDEEEHVGEVRTLTTLAGYVHWRLTGQKVLGVGDASGVFPIDPVTKNYDAKLRESYDSLVADRHPGFRLAEVLPSVLAAGAQAGSLTSEGAALLDTSGTLRAGIPFCPPEGDAGTGMVATCAVAPRTGNVSAGTSIFSMVVLERSLSRVHEELDVVTTPAGDPVAMVHCNNGASELSAWVRLFSDFATAAGQPIDGDAVFETLFTQALAGESDAGGLLAYNHLSGEPIAGLSEGRPLVVRTPDSTLSLPNFMRAQIYGVFATLALGMRVLAEEGVKIDAMYAHGGLFKTAGVAQRVLAGAIDAPVAVAETAGEGGAWGIAVLAAYTVKADGRDLGAYLSDAVFGDSAFAVVEPSADDVAGFARYLERYRAGLAAERAAVDALA
ncbi:sugar (pentulose or hexulose) kinase [Microbacterium endophyticum]|uniref:Sugar (Pentulose or hexulose) kinase n=1 Tax=Microbacterium endophyticum TaxID=1526412 RepID=A0A7W4YMV4_9MICO|nr:FGGY-family carbohydrate kinase [Microbacterium endophyticum]MBB2975909.1 sugar (pentulose or hexulose) kinase [Microbacterium endophyticum]NIK36392.1 sugar (pentulose or hexulose) kinase [Microbacterium endophyticum]